MLLGISTAFMLVLDHHRSRAETLANLRRLMPRLEHVSCATRAFSFGHSEIDLHLPRGGLPADALHEIAPYAENDAAAAFGFATALAQMMAEAGPVLFISSMRVLNGVGEPHGHGLNALGLNPVRVMFIKASNETEALWAIEEALNSSVPGVIMGAIGKDLKLKQSQRLSVATGKSGIPLLLLRPADAWGASAAATRWRIGGAEASRDRFGLIERWRWRAALERCRNGRIGEWLVEWDHAAHRFSLAAPVADPEVSRERGEDQFVRGAG